MRRGIEKAADAIVKSLLESAKDVETKEQIAATATISAADSEVGERIAEALDKVGQDGVVTVEDNNKFGLDLDFTEGMRFDKGYISPYFVTNPEDQTAVWKIHTSCSHLARYLLSRILCMWLNLL